MAVIWVPNFLTSQSTPSSSSLLWRRPLKIVCFTTRTVHMYLTCSQNFYIVDLTSSIRRPRPSRFLTRELFPLLQWDFDYTAWPLSSSSHVRMKTMHPQFFGGGDFWIRWNLIFIDHYVHNVAACSVVYHLFLWIHYGLRRWPTQLRRIE